MLFINYDEERCQIERIDKSGKVIKRIINNCSSKKVYRLVGLYHDCDIIINDEKSSLEKIFENTRVKIFNYNRYELKSMRDYKELFKNQNACFIFMEEEIHGVLINDNKIIKGKNNFAGKFKNIKVFQSPVLDKKSFYNDTLGKKTNQLNINLFKNRLLSFYNSVFEIDEVITFRDLVMASFKQDRLALKVLDRAIEGIVDAMINIVYTIDPEVFVFKIDFGGVNKYFMDKIETCFYKTIEVNNIKTKIVFLKNKGSLKLKSVFML
ncbi:MAG: hypothetical protein RBQ97_00360 [Acholeplasma sp.]|nr:hypothetical protein [Acholeplasma sp.]